jgi:segregation and condensation protein A
MEAPVYHLENVVQSRSERENFDGPLDLILTLLSRNKMEIQDIQISLLLEQYMEWMNQQKELNLDVASEFVSMASHLVYIKTKMLLAINDGEEISELSELVAALEERKRSENYSRVKVLLPQLQKRYESGVDYLSRGQLPVTPDKTYRYQHPPEDLYNAMMELLRRSQERPVPPELAFRGIVGREPYPVADKAREVLAHLVKGGVTKFRHLFRSSRSRSEIVATFLAVLELCKNHRIHLAGSGEDCTVTSISPPNQQDSEEKET